MAGNIFSASVFGDRRYLPLNHELTRRQEKGNQ